MPKFKSTKEAQDAHRGYDIDTDAEGKYNAECPQRGYLRVAWLLDNIPNQSFVLEVGCNSGGLLRLLSKDKQCYVKGIDISKIMVERSLMKGIHAVHGAAEELPFGDGLFEVVIMTEILEHIFEPELALREAFRVLRPGGIFIGSVPHPDSHNTHKRSLEDHDWHCHVFTEEQLSKMFRKLYDDVLFDTVHWLDDHKEKPQWTMWICKKSEVSNEGK